MNYRRIPCLIEDLNSLQEIFRNSVLLKPCRDIRLSFIPIGTFLTLQRPTPPNDETHSNNLLPVSRQIV